MSLADRVFPKTTVQSAPGAAPQAHRAPAGAPAGAPPAANGSGSRPELLSPVRRPRGSAGVLPPGGGAAVMPTDLLERRRQLAIEFAELQWDLGGLAYEMAARDHFRPDVLVRRAARLQDIDAQLGEVERLLRMEEAGAAGSCPACGALHGRNAVYCWQCGEQLMPKQAAP